MIEWILPIKTVSESNSSEHWSKKHKRHKAQRHRISVAFMEHRKPIQLPCTITMTRLAPRKLDDDNLRGALKWIRDAIADQIIPGKACGRADDDERITWQYGQESAKEQGVKITFSQELFA